MIVVVVVIMTMVMVLLTTMMTVMMVMVMGADNVRADPSQAGHDPLYHGAGERVPLQTQAEGDGGDDGWWWW